MKAALFNGPCSIAVQEAEIPEVPAGFALLRSARTGICGSDLHMYRGEWGQPRYAGGHELAGMVVRTGAGVTRVAVGDKACAECFSHCGACRFCRMGEYHLCDHRVFIAAAAHGGFAEYALLHESSLYRLPSDMDLERGALVEPLAVSHRAVHQTGLRGGETVAVIGSGAIGLMAVLAARVLGAGRVIATARYPHQAEMAERMGAGDALLGEGETLRKAVQERTGGMGVDRVVETTATESGFRDALHLARKGGSISLVGGYWEPIRADLGMVVGKELSVAGSCCYGFEGARTDFEAAIDLLHSGRVQADAVVSHRFSLEEIADAFRTAHDKRSGAVKVMVCQDETVSPG